LSPNKKEVWWNITTGCSTGSITEF